jgi:hypothetical protein
MKTHKKTFFAPLKFCCFYFKIPSPKIFYTFRPSPRKDEYFFSIVGVINALWQIAGIFLTLATYKLETLYYYVNATYFFLLFFSSSQYAASGSEGVCEHQKIIHIYCRTKQFGMSIAWVGV